MCAAEAASTQNLWKIGRSTGAWLNVSKIGMMEEGKNCTLARFMISPDNVRCSSAPYPVASSKFVHSVLRGKYQNSA